MDASRPLGTLTVDDIYKQLEEVATIPEATQQEYAQILHSGEVDGKEKLYMRNQILLSNQKLLLLMALKFYWNTNNRDVYNKNEMILTLYSAANMGFLYALDRYDPSTNVKITTYAANWCKFYMQLELLNYIGTTRTIYKMERQVKRMLAEGEEFGRLKKWADYILSTRAVSQIDYPDDLKIELKMALDNLGREGKLLKDYYGIDIDAESIDLCKKYNFTSQKMLEMRVKEAQEKLYGYLKELDEEAEEVLYADTDSLEAPDQIQFGFMEEEV